MKRELPEEKQAALAAFVGRLFSAKQCPACSQQYDLSDHTPKIIPFCGHTFCIECLSRTTFGNRLKCPACLKVSSGVENVDLLPTNHLIYSNIIDALPKEKIRQERSSLFLPGQLELDRKGRLAFFRDGFSGPHRSQREERDA